jgi:hypothetical protein
MDQMQQVTESTKLSAGYERVHVQGIIRQAQGELRQLEHRRADIVRRIGTIKRTIAGLTKLFGEEILSHDMREMLGRNYIDRKPGFTRACRTILMESPSPISASDICDYFKQKMPMLLARHKAPMTSVTTVLSRLVQYGEAKALLSPNGKRQWVRAIERETEISSTRSTVP